MTKTVRYFTCFLCFFFFIGTTRAEEPVRSNSFLFGFGSSRQLDTYLSPFTYHGKQLSVLHESERMTHWADHRISFLQFTQGTVSLSDAPSGNAREAGGHIGYDAGWKYNWTAGSHLRFAAGGLMGTDLGFLYNDRNGNNPAQGRFNIDLSATASADWDFRLWRRDAVLRWQAHLPFLGCMFSPQYGQSYYEIGQGHLDHNVVCTYLFNAFSIRQLLTMEIPIHRSSIRFGYLMDVRQSNVNHIKVSDCSHSFLLGYVRYFTSL